MSKNGKGNRKHMTGKGADDCSLSDILFKLGKERNHGDDEMDEILSGIMNGEGIDEDMEAKSDSGDEDYYRQLLNADWCNKLGLDRDDLAILSYLWCRYLYTRHECKVRGILEEVYHDAAQGYKHLPRIARLLQQGLIVASTESRVENPWAGFFFATVDRFLYNHSVYLSQDMIDFITGKQSEFIPLSTRPFTSQNDHLYSWIGIWDTAWLIFSNSMEHCEFGHQWVIEENPIVRQMLELQHAREAATPFKMRYKDFCDKFALTDAEVLFLTLYMKSDLEEELEHFWGRWNNNPKFYETMHSHLVKNIRRSNLFEFSMMYVSREGKLVDADDSYNHYDISPWVKEVLYHNAPVLQDNKQNRDPEVIAEFVEANKTIELLTPKYCMQDLVLPSKEQQTIDRIIAFEKSGTRHKMRAWGVQGWDKGAQGKGFSAIFHGLPGTGKTLAAEAIAKETGKVILKTDSSLILSKWFGQTEHNAKELFSRFNELCGKVKNPPILLFNEADQLLSTRDAGLGTSTDKCWHALQNLFLESLESSPGMIIATTNLLPTLDEAYSRRFDAILEFPIPSRENREKIWKNILPAKLPGYAALDFRQLAEYKFSGGQINKIVRNACLHLASGLARQKQMSTAIMLDFCEQELRESFEAKDKARKPVGFGKIKGE